jgi:hypothetical protein
VQLKAIVNLDAGQISMPEIGASGRITKRTLALAVPRQRHGGTSPGRTLPIFHLWTGLGVFPSAHAQVRCTDYPFKLLGPTVGTFHFHFIVATDDQKFKNLVTF